MTSGLGIDGGNKSLRQRRQPVVYGTAASRNVREFWAPPAPPASRPTGTSSGSTKALRAFYGFVLNAGEFTSFDAPGAIATDPFGINAQDDIVGVSVDATGIVHGFLRRR